LTIERDRLLQVILAGVDVHDGRSAIEQIVMAQATNGTSDQSGAGTAGTGSNTTNSQADQNSGTTATNPATTNGQTPDAAAGTQDQNANTNGAAAAHARNRGANPNGGTLPKTATPLPIIAGIGVGLIGAGILTRKRNRRKAQLI
jgi:LPXTG-motif cell wall-anchored protein